MELCTVQAVSKHKLVFQNPNPNPYTSSSSSSYKPSLLSLARRPSLSALAIHSGSLNSLSFVARATPSEGTSNGASYGGEERDSVATLEDVSPQVTKEEPTPVYGQTSEPQVATAYGISTQVTEKESSPESDEQTPIFEFLEKLNIDTSDPYPLVLYGGGTLFILWLSSAIVGAIDAIPVFPKLMELVGLGYTFWFTYRYLIFKSKREELWAKIEELKEEVI